MNPVLHELLARVTSVRHSASSSSLESSSNHNDDGTPGRVRGYLVTSYSPVQREEPDYKAWTSSASEGGLNYDGNGVER